MQLGDHGVSEGFEHQASICVFLPRVSCHGPHRGSGAWIDWYPAAVLPVVGCGGGEGTHQLWDGSNCPADGVVDVQGGGL